MRRVDYYVIIGGMAFAVIWNLTMTALAGGVLVWQAHSFASSEENAKFVECLYLIADGVVVKKYKLDQPPLRSGRDCPFWITLGSAEAKH
jgi:hypothetical protein